jgi:CBS domain-containing protein
MAVTPEGYAEDEDEVDFDGKEAEVTQGLMTSPIRALHPRPAVCVPLDHSVAEAVGKMNGEGIGAVLIVDGDRLVGIFTERDVLRKIAGRGLDFTKIYVRDYMTPQPESLSLDHKLAYALNKMVVGGYRHVPLVDASGAPVAVISVRDIVEFIVERFPQEVINLPPDPDHEMRKAEGG